MSYHFDQTLRNIQDKWHFCELCNKEFCTTSQRNIHMRCHPGERLYEYNTCGQTLTNNGNLHRHRLKHMEQKPYQCVFCGMGFIAKDLLWNHIIRKIEERPHGCKVCKKLCATRALLISHIRAHQPGKYKCAICPKVYKGSTDLKIHLQKKHSNEA